MIFGQDRGELRAMYADAWQKHIDKSPMSPLEAEIASVVEMHPEYHADVTGGDLEKEFVPEGGHSNPYLHMGLHLGVREQVATDRPSGIRRIFEWLAGSTGDAHNAEHQMIECLAETLWEAQRDNVPPDEAQYIERLSRLMR